MKLQIQPKSANGIKHNFHNDVITALQRHRLQANYEYNAESCVRSSDVLEQYNRVHNAKIRFLSQIGRIIRVVFPNARHIRR